ncbi:thioredoxin family protein [Maribellus maritimus]|uniref:thioredoxin family protein n=1 Tax=Maribellus maritimus TaxID=2870838 RepID=UPI001EEC83E3|nr:thioredoxin family protein [Maribellus maritimus]MCG6188240.1 thioredoxin family protein [Maribellus maritimus]
MKNLFAGIIILFTVNSIYAQEIKIYDPEANAKEELADAVKKASMENKHVFIQVGGNWCPWCIKFHRFVDADSEIKIFVEENFEIVRVNYDPKNKNKEVLAGLEFPQRFGFPVFVILDGEGNRIHTQNSAFLEKDDGYDRNKVLRFFKNWAPSALEPENYK